jgi:hypothetical protein
MIYDELERSLRTRIGTHADLVIDALREQLGGSRVYFPSKRQVARIGNETVLQFSRRTGIKRGKVYANLSVLRESGG